MWKRRKSYRQNCYGHREEVGERRAGFVWASYAKYVFLAYVQPLSVVGRRSKDKQHY